MRTSTSCYFTAGFLSFFLFGLSGCEKIRNAASKLSKPEAKTVEEPVVKSAYRREQITDITPGSYGSFIAKNDALVVVDFHAEWCGPCKMLGPVLAKATEQHPGVVYLGKMNVDQAGDFPGKQGVGGIPDVRLFRDGKEVDRFVGFPGESAVLEMITKHAKGIRPPAPAPASLEPTIKPFTKDWLPPGMSRKGEEPPAKTPVK